MKLLLSCMKCLQESGQPDMDFHHVEIRDDGRYELTCAKGHQTVSILQQQKFEILFEIGLHAILNGYYREAVSSFTSSLERFYEFAVRAIHDKMTGSDELYQQCWAKVSNQSERQLGAFILLWASHFGELPELLSDDWVSVRNQVIHKGKIPNGMKQSIMGLP